VKAQHADFSFGIYAPHLDVIQQYEATRERAVDAFNPNGVFALVLPTQTPFAADGDGTADTAILTSSLLTSGRPILMRYKFSLGI
jgi:hypothetical protein